MIHSRYSNFQIEQDLDGVYFYHGQYHVFLDGVLRAIKDEMKEEYKKFRSLDKELGNMLKLGVKVVNTKEGHEVRIGMEDLKYSFKKMIDSCESA